MVRWGWFDGDAVSRPAEADERRRANRGYCTRCWLWWYGFIEVPREDPPRIARSFMLPISQVAGFLERALYSQRFPRICYLLVEVTSQVPETNFP